MMCLIKELICIKFSSFEIISIYLNFKRRKNMKATGVVRRIDDLGRVVIPKEIRKTLRIKERRSFRNFYR